MGRDEAVGALRRTGTVANYLAANGYQATLNDHDTRVLDDYARVEAGYGDDEGGFDLLCQQAGLRPSDIGLLSGAVRWQRQKRSTGNAGL